MKRQPTLKTLLLSLLIVLTAGPLHAAGARRGWTKIELSHADGRSAPVSHALLERFGAELIGDYGAYSIVYAPKGIVTALEAQAKKENIRLRVRDELDLLQLPNATVDAREGISGVPPGKLARDYAPGKPGVYVVQFTAPLRAEWMDLLADQGWKFSRYMPNNAYLLIGTPELTAQTRQLPFVQWLDFYHPYQKAQYLANDGQAHDLLFELAERDTAAIEAIRALAEGNVEVTQNALDTRVYARMNAAAADELLRHELVLSVSPRPQGRLSDERQVMSLTSNLTAGQTQPTNPTGYWSWITSRCAECTNMPAATWKIGIADSGLDDGANIATQGHPDLKNRKFYGNRLYGGDHDVECAPDKPLCDAYSHGTLVAGIAAGKASAGFGFVDSGGFYLGQGVAETAGIFATKIFSKLSEDPWDLTRVLSWTADAGNNGVTVQNHSWNEYAFGLGARSGIYSTVSRDFDIAARDSDGQPNFSRNPVLFTISSGNTNQGAQNEERYLTLAGATAKNVLAMGGLENVRTHVPACGSTRADSFQNIMRISRIGTTIPGYIKPDLMAPASLIVSAHTSVLWPNPSVYCLGAFAGFHQYTGANGTSFAAPVGAGAAMLVKRYLGLAPSDISPALTKAVLIAGARSVRGGLDRTRDLNGTVITQAPSPQQGFGRLTLEDILNNAQKPIVFDQASGSRTFTAPGQSFTTSVRVRDASKPVKIALVWTDTPAAAFSESPLVNDLNLEVQRSSNPYTVHVGNRLAVATEAKGEESIAYPTFGGLPYDNINNVEFFRLFLNPGEELTVTVKAWAINGDTNGNLANNEQDFALAILNADKTCETVTIVQQPQHQTIQPGQTATVTVVPGGTGPWDFQWYTGPSGTFGTPVCANTASCTVGPLTQTTQFWVRVRGSCDGTQLFSNAATITVQCTTPPTITAQPSSRVTNPGQSTTLSVGASQAVSYQWFQGTAPSTATPVGTNSPFLTVAPTATTNYWVRVTNACGSTNSVTATVCVLPSISAHPTSRTINPPQSTTLTVTASNATTYQWFQGTAPSTTTPVGTNSSSLTVAPAVTTSYWVRVSNTCGSVNSTTATVTVTPVPPANITRIQSSFALANSQTSITANWSQPTQAGTLLVAVISGRKDPNGSVVWTAPAGWVQANTNEWLNIKASIYYIPNNAGGRTSETFTVAQGFHDQTLYLFEYSGIVAVSPVDRIATAGDDTNDGFVQTGFTANTVQAKELVITALTTYTPTEFYSPSSGFTELYDKFIGNRLTTAAHEKITTTVGSYGHNSSVLDPAQWIGLVVTFKGAN